MAISDILQIIADARVDARSLSEFVFKPADFMVKRRLGGDIHTLKHYLDNFDETKTIISAYVATIPTIVNDAINNTAVAGGVLADTFVTMTANGAGTVPRSLRDVNSDTTNLTNFIPPIEMAAIKNHASTYDCSAALAAAVATGKRVTVPTAGTYSFTTGYNGTTNFDVVATTEGVIFDLNAVTAAYAIVNSGAVLKINTQNNAAIVAGSRVALGVNITGLQTGDWLCFYNPTDFSYSEYRANYRAGEWKQIAYVDGTNVYFTKPFYADYAANTLDIYKLNSVKCHIENIHVLHKNLKSGAIKFTFSSNASDKDMTFDSKAGAVITYDRCVGHKSINPNGHNVGNNQGLDYGIVVSNSQHGRINGGDIYSQRHAAATGGGNDICSVPVSDFRVYDATLTNDPQFTIGAADFHGNTRDSSYERCNITGGTNIGGGDRCYYIDCDIASNKDGVVGFGRELIGGDFGYIDCRAIAMGNPQLASGVATFDFGGASEAFNSKTKSALKLNIVNFKFKTNTVFEVDNVSFCKVTNRGSTQKFNINIDDVTFDMPMKFKHLLLLDLKSGIAASDGIIVDNISGNTPKSIVAGYAASQGYLDAPMRLQQLSGKLLVTTQAVSTQLTPTVTLPFLYPKNANVQLTARLGNGISDTTIAGQSTYALIPIQATTDRIQARINAPAAFTAGTAIEIIYTVGIRDI